ncbi:MAG: amidophosphoribosyltransferase [Planctomycetes bacterium]|nr:amidophosphoribosyltransferase [Planctomycetota bacterium]
MTDCGLFGVWGPPNAADLAYLGLYAQQHRGQESAGMATLQQDKLIYHKGMGLVADVFSRDTLNRLKSRSAVGHVRYSTSGSSNLSNAQPIVVETSSGMMAIAHNGNLVNSTAVRHELETQARFSPIFHTTTDTEIILYLVARGTNIMKGIQQAAARIRGAYSLVFLTPRELVAVRDPRGFRPLVLGRLGSHTAVASETCAFDLSGIRYERDIEPGEILHIDDSGVRSEHMTQQAQPAFCMFEHVYFARPDSVVNGDLVHAVRRQLGRRLAQEHPVEADVVTPIPDSGMSAALGFAEASGIPFDLCFIRNHYVGRTFIQPQQDDRDAKVEIKLAVIPQLVKGKRVVVVDDSIIRGTTSLSRIKMLRRSGAKEVHLRVSCPPTRFPCYYGIDFPDPSRLIADGRTVEEIRQKLGVDSLGYLSLKGMLETMSHPQSHYCTACWTGTYVVPPVDEMKKDRLEQAAPKVQSRGSRTGERTNG